MKLKISALVIVLVTAIVLFSSNFQAENDYSKEKLITKLVYTGIQKWHYSDKKLDINFSEQAFKEFMDNMDNTKRFFLKSDIEELQKYKDKISEEFSSGDTEIVNLAKQILDKRIQQVIGFYEEILSKPFDFTQAETIEFDPKKIDYCSTIDELKDTWRKTLKYYTLLRYIAKIEDKSKDPKKSEKELEEESRKAVAKSFKSIFNRQIQGNENDSLSRYINSILQVYDPHSLYFPPTDKESFDMEMSGSFEGIGASLQNEDEYVKVFQIMPGGPAWRQKLLQAGDIILKVAQDKEEAVDIIGMRTQEAVQLIRGKKGTLVRLTVKKPDGQIKEIPIVRDVVILEETFAKSAIVTHEKSGKKFGYILLPGFYDDFKSEYGRNSTDDVKKELEKLKAKNVDGIILDLRNNTGGALQDAVNMSGLFISKGPIVQVKNKKSQVDVLEDRDPSITYSGPLIVLINHLSASASEILAAALQDYNRAVIVGCNSFGKGTVQAMINLDRFIYQDSDKEKNLGALTITIQQFFRVNGSSTQTRGVIPDIALPDRLDSIDIGEKFLDNPLQWNSISSASYEKWRPLSPELNELVGKSKTRIQSIPGFEALNQYIKIVKNRRETTRLSLQLTEVMKEQEIAKKEAEKFEKATTESSILKASPSANLPKKEPESLEKLSKELQDDWFKTIGRDLILGEAAEIMNDMTDLQRRK